MTMLESLLKGIEEKRCAVCFYFGSDVTGGYGLCDNKIKVVDCLNTCEKWKLNPYTGLIIEELKGNGLSNTERDA